MADRRWEGRAIAVAQVNTITIAGSWAGGNTVTISINAKDMVITIGSLTTTAQVATTIQEAWEGATFTDTTATVTPAGGGQDIVEHAEFTATVSGSVVTLTHDAPGTPATLGVVETASGTATLATATAATGPNHWDNADNWSGAAVPVNSDDVYIDNTDIPILYGLDQSAVTLTSLTIAQNFVGTIGLPKTNEAGYVEYRDDYLQISSSAVTIGRGPGSGSGRIKLDVGTAQTTISIADTGSPAEAGVEAFLFQGTHVSNTIEVLSGSVGIAVFGGESATKVASLKVNTGSARVGTGATAITVLTNNSGTVECYRSATTLTNGGGTTLVGGDAAVTTLNVDAGTVDYRSSGTITTLATGGPRGATIDFSNDDSPRTITNATLDAGSQIIDPLRTVTYTNKIGLGGSAESVLVN